MKRLGVSWLLALCAAQGVSLTSFLFRTKFERRSISSEDDFAGGNCRSALRWVSVEHFVVAQQYHIDRPTILFKRPTAQGPPNQANLSRFRSPKAKKDLEKSTTIFISRQKGCLLSFSSSDAVTTKHKSCLQTNLPAVIQLSLQSCFLDSDVGFVIDMTQVSSARYAQCLRYHMPTSKYLKCRILNFLPSPMVFTNHST